MLRYKDKISAQCKKLVLYHVENDGLAFQCHSKFACVALIFRVIVTTGKIYNTLDFTLDGLPTWMVIPTSETMPLDSINQLTMTYYQQNDIALATKNHTQV